MTIIKEWVSQLGLRHQGVLISAVRGPDGVNRDDPIKNIVRMYRGIILNSHCGDINNAISYMTPFNYDELNLLGRQVVKSLDHYNIHFWLHLLHAIEIIGYHHPDNIISEAFSNLYRLFCRKMHIQPETKDYLDHRLNLDETAFGQQQE